MKKIAWLAFLLVGCVTPTYNLKDVGASTIRAGDVVNVYISEEVKLRIERVEDEFGHHPKASTGPLWANVFVGSDPEFRIEVLNSRLSSRVAGAGFTIRNHYDVSARLICGKREFALSATGTRAAAMQIIEAMREAVEIAIRDLARQATVTMMRDCQK